jgi:hypothetical protein
MCSSDSVPVSSRISSKPFADTPSTSVRSSRTARGALHKAGSAGQAGAANSLLKQALGHVFAVAEAYPQLHASENFSASVRGTGRR